jgi:hypothetical protein
MVQRGGARRRALGACAAAADQLVFSDPVPEEEPLRIAVLNRVGKQPVGLLGHSPAFGVGDGPGLAGQMP